MSTKTFLRALGLVLVPLLINEPLFATNSDNGPGCGLGKLAWADYGGQKQILPQAFMFTTNGTFSSGAFGISFGTSGCTNDGVLMKNKQIKLADSAFENLTQEMARGEGEHLAALATLLGVHADEQPRLFGWLQAHYQTVIPPGEPSASTLVHAFEMAIAAHHPPDHLVAVSKSGNGLAVGSAEQEGSH